MKDLVKTPSAADVIALLAKRHEKDVWVPECKDGPTQFGPHVRMDGWAMRKSWANPCVTGYEVKVSRSDFLSDDKWPAYLPCCNVLYFVCPTGVIRPDEVSPSVGLLWVAATGRTLITKKKAPFRELQIPESVYRYILMCRSRITRDTSSGDERETGAKYWREWLNQRDDERRLGWNVSKKVAEMADKLQDENNELRNKMATYDDVRAMLKELGFTEPDKEWVSRHAVKAKLMKLTEMVPPWFVPTLKRLEEQSCAIRSELERQSLSHAA